MKQTKGLKVERVKTSQLSLHPHNARQGDVGAICQSLEAHGQYRPLVVQRSTGNVLAGNHTLQAAQALGWSEVDVTYIDVDDDQALRILLVDNRSNDLATYDNSVLTDLLEALVRSDFGLEGTGFDGSDLDDLLAEFQEDTEAEVKEDTEVPAIPENPVTKLGDVWLLGPHRLICGDSMAEDIWRRLLNGKRPDAIYTDPPYGMNLDTDYSQFGGKKHKPVIGDNRPFDPAPIMQFFADVPEQFWWGADYYRDCLPNGGSWTVWDKRSDNEPGHYDEMFGSCFELCWSRQPHRREIARILWVQSHGRQDVHKEDRFVHPTQKPSSLAIWHFDRWVSNKALVLDLFGGSGSTLIACEQTNRTAYLSELDPAYCDVIAKRYQRHSGIVPILESTGKSHTFLD